MLVPAALLLIALHPTAATKYGPLEEVHAWARLDFDWPTSEEREQALAAEDYVPEHCILADVKAVDGQLFVTVPRWRHGVPASVNRVVAAANGSVLRPYPSWEMNKPGDCGAIQYAHVVEIDPMRRMWIVDTGKQGHFSRPKTNCTAKLVVWDMVANKEVRRHEFPDEVVDRQRSMLRGVVVDSSAKDPEDWFAYIASSEEERLVVYSWRADASWTVEHSSMRKVNTALGVEVGGELGTFPVGIDSLALSGNLLFYAAVSSFEFYSVPTEPLRNRSSIDNEVRSIGTRKSQSEGMTISDSGVMFYNVLADSAVHKWNTSAPFSAMDRVWQDDQKLQWVDSFGWDAPYLYFTSNRMQVSAVLLPVPEGEVLFRVLRARVDMAGYMGPYREGQKVGASAAARAAAAGWAALLLLVTVLAAV